MLFITWAIPGGDDRSNYRAATTQALDYPTIRWCPLPDHLAERHTAPPNYMWRHPHRRRHLFKNSAPNSKPKTVTDAIDATPLQLSSPTHPHLIMIRLRVRAPHHSTINELYTTDCNDYQNLYSLSPSSSRENN